MKPKELLLILISLVLLLSGGCTSKAVQTQTPTFPSVSSSSNTPTLSPSPTDTLEPTPTPKPEFNVALNKPVRVSASWVVDPPERAVDGNLNDWWGAGGPAPAWIEVDLGGLYSISKIQVYNQGPTGNIPYQVFGRSLDGENKLLHVFDGTKSENQRLTFSPDIPWEDISTIRIEISSGSGWVGLREVQVFSREEPKPLPVSNHAAVPLFMAGVVSSNLDAITAENAIFLKQLAMLGRGPINQIIWSPNGKTLVAATPTGLWLYNPANLKDQPLFLEGHTRDVLNASFDLTGTTIFSASQDGTVKQWDAATGALKRTTSLWDDFSYEVGEQKRDAEVWNTAFNSQGTLLAAGSFDGTVRIWDRTTGKLSREFGGHNGQVNLLAFSPDGSLLAYCDYTSLYIWDIQTGNSIAILPIIGNLQSLVFGPDGKTLAYGGIGMSVRLWDIVTKQELTELAEVKDILNLAYTPDGKFLAYSGVDGTISLRDMDSGISSLFKENVGLIRMMSFSPDGTRLAANTWDGVTVVWETVTKNQVSVVFNHNNAIDSVAFSPSNKVVAAGTENGMILFWNVETHQLISVYVGHNGSVSDLAFSPDGLMLASSGLDGTVRLWDLMTGDISYEFSGHESMVRCVAFSPDGTLIASGGTDTTVRLWDVASGEEKAVLTGHTGEVEDLAFSPDSKWLLSASADFSIKIWDVTNEVEVRPLKGNLSFVNGVAFSPLGDAIASAGGDHFLRAWNLKIDSGQATSSQRFNPIGHGGWVLDVAFSPDGMLIAGANVSTTSYWVAPGEIHIYSAKTAYPLALLRAHTKRVNSIAFSPDGKLLASCSADGTVRLWGVQSE
jgi:WD40 repeat protein